MKGGEIHLVRPQADQARRLWLWVTGFFLCNGLLAASGWLFTARRMTQVPPGIKQEAENITRRLFPEAPFPALTWSHIGALTSTQGVWAAEIRRGEYETGRLIFAPGGRLRQCSLSQSPGSPLTAKAQAILAARHYLRALDGSSLYYCHLTALPPRHSHLTPEGSWQIWARRSGKRVHLTLDARTGALLFFIDADCRPADRRLPQQGKRHNPQEEQ